MLRAYDRGLGFVFRHQFVTLLSTLVLIGLDRLPLRHDSQRAFSRSRIPGSFSARLDARQDISFAAMAKLTHQIVDIVRQDPAVSGVFSFTGASAYNPTENTARMFIQLKPHDQRDRDLRPDHPAAAPQGGRRSRASNFSCSPGRTSASAGG